MVVTLAFQLKQLLVMMICGFVFAFLYDILRAFRRTVPHGLFYISVEDLFFWLFCSVGIFMAVLRLNYGQMRLFLVLGAIIGAAFYYWLISPVFLKMSMIVSNIFKLCLKILLSPFVITAETLNVIFKHFVNNLKKVLKKYKKYGKMIVDKFLRCLSVIFKKY